MTASAIARAVRADNERIRREACATCGDRCAPFTCAWACEVPTAVYAAHVRVGEILVTPKSKLLAPVIAVEMSKTEWGGSGLSVAWSTVITAEYRKGRSKPPYPHLVYHRAGGQQMHVLRPGVCGARACEAHVREVGEGVAYCRAHWRAWMESS